MKLWGGRFESGPSEVFERFSGSLHFDGKLVGRRLPRFAGLRPGAGARGHSDRRRVAAAWWRLSKRSASKPRDPAFFEGATDEDVHTLVIRKLKERVGALADKIHTGRSRNEQVSLDVRLWLRDADRRHPGTLGRCACLRWWRWRASIRTPSSPATRTCAAPRPCCGRITCWRISKCSRATRSGSAQARARVDVMPLGSGALAGSGFPLRPRSHRARPGLRRHHAQQHGCLGRPRLRARLPLRGVGHHAAPEPPGRRLDSSIRATSSAGWNWATASPADPA